MLLEKAKEDAITILKAQNRMYNDLKKVKPKDMIGYISKKDWDKNSYAVCGYFFDQVYAYERDDVLITLYNLDGSIVQQSKTIKKGKFLLHHLDPEKSYFFRAYHPEIGVYQAYFSINNYDKLPDLKALCCEKTKR